MLKNFLLYCSRQDWIKKTVLAVPFSGSLARRFMAGETLDEALQAVRDVTSRGLKATIDHLGEHVTDPDEAQAAVEEYLEALDRIHSEGLDCNVSMKLSELGQDIDDELALKNAETVLARAKERDNFVRIDMESSDYTQRTLDTFVALRERYENVGIVLQSYLYRTKEDIPALLAKGAGMRLCKGAYDEPKDRAYPAKSDTDAAYRHQVTRLLESGIYHGIATHDEAMIDWTLQEVSRLGICSDAFEFQMLYGVRRDLQAKLVEDGWRVRIYIPFGKNWYPYFTRRMAERPANLVFIMKALLKG